MSAIPILTYHATRVGSGQYGSDDMVTLREDLRILWRAGWKIVPLHDIARAVVKGTAAEMTRCVGLSFDDGTDLDWRDVDHPALGRLRGLAGILKDIASETSRPLPHATSFVIAGPEPRRELDVRSLSAAGWWNDDWWLTAVRGSLAIENHSWDHNHEQVSAPPGESAARGTFLTVDSWAQCDHQIRQAADYIDRKLSPVHRCSLFAYPYGEYSDFLVECYLPEHRHEHRQQAAFTTAGEPAHAGSDCWRIPRFVCGQHWTTPEDLQAILRACA